MLARLGRAFVIAALLLAQHAAITHEIWHATAAASAQASQAPGGKANKLCQLHDLLGTVLGVASGTAPAPVFVDVAASGYVDVAPTVRQAPRFAPHSRDPPLAS